MRKLQRTQVLFGKSDDAKPRFSNRGKQLKDHLLFADRSGLSFDPRDNRQSYSGHRLLGNNHSVNTSLGGKLDNGSEIDGPLTILARGAFRARSAKISPENALVSGNRAVPRL